MGCGRDLRYGTRAAVAAGIGDGDQITQPFAAQVVVAQPLLAGLHLGDIGFAIGTQQGREDAGCSRSHRASG